MAPVLEVPGLSIGLTQTNRLLYVVKGWRRVKYIGMAGDRDSLLEG